MQQAIWMTNNVRITWGDNLTEAAARFQQRAATCAKVDAETGASGGAPEHDVRKATEMTWTMHKIKQDEIKTFLERQDFPAAMREFLETNGGVPISSWITREFAVNDDGVWIEPWGSTQRGWTTMFRYWHREVYIKFEAHRPAGRSDNWVDYDSTNKTFANNALGPQCAVWIDDRHHRLPPDAAKLVKENITEFLTKEFHQFELAVAPYAEAVAFY